MKKTFTHKNIIAILLIALIVITSIGLTGCKNEKSVATPDSVPTSVATVDETAANTENTTQTVTESITVAPTTSTSATEVTKVDETASDKHNDNQNIERPENTIVSEGNTSPQHTHSYGWVTIKADCTNDGYTVYSCACGAKYTSDYVDALGHEWGGWVTVKEATSESEGKRENICNRCGKVKNESIDKIANPYDASCRSDEDLLAERILYYINQYKNVDASFFYDMKQYADMRSAQLSDNFAHDLDDIREVSNALKYGNCIIEEETIFNWETNQIEKTGNIIEYYDGIPSEAIGKITSCSGSIDEVAYEVATMFYESSGHWNYVGADDTLSIAVGVYFDGPNFYTCLIMG